MTDMLAFCGLVIIAISCASVHAAPGDAEITDLQFSNNVVNEGESFQLICRIRNATRHHTLSFYKQGRDPTNGSLIWYILSNNEEAYYEDLDFTFTLEEEGLIDRYILNSPYANSLSSGNYSCNVRSSSLHFNVNKTALLSVIDEPSSVDLYVDGVLVQPDSFRTFNLSSVHSLQCVAKDSNPPAMIEIWHGTQDLSRQITNRSDGVPMYAPAPNPAYPFKASISYSTNVSISKWRIDVTYQDQSISCLAKASHNSNPTSVRFYPTVEDGPPHFICNDTYWLPKTTVTDGFEISCEVVSKPPLTDALFGCETQGICTSFSGYPINVWQPKPDTVYSGLVVNTNTEDMRSTSIVKGRMTLKIRMPRDAIVLRKFTFTAKNVKGQAIHKVQLLGAPKLFSGVATILASTLALCLISLQSHL